MTFAVAANETGAKVLTMSKEYIEREKALEKVIEVKHHDPELSGVVLHRYIKEIDLKDIPAADVAPVRRGRWKSTGVLVGLMNFEYFYRCTACGRRGGDTKTNYCPHCGALMDKGE